MCATFPILQGSLWLQAQPLHLVSEITDTASNVPWFLILYVPVHPSSDIQMSGFLQSPSVWVEKLLLNYGCFNNCRLKGRDEESMSCCHNANVTPSQGLR